MYDRAFLSRLVGRVAVLSNQNSICSLTGKPFHEVVNDCTGGRVRCLLGPQHGFFGVQQDNMIESSDSVIQLATGEIIPLFSLYSDVREPTTDQLALFDTVVVDLQDIGCRIYTYMYSAFNVLKCAVSAGKHVVIVDRQNPVGLSSIPPWLDASHDPSLVSATLLDGVEGSPLSQDLCYTSFVSNQPIPYRHGLTMAEMMLLLAKLERITLQVVFQPEESVAGRSLVICRCGGLMRRVPQFLQSFCQYRQHSDQLSSSAALICDIFLPSPNMNSIDCTRAFLPNVLFEATNISEGRGTTLPFQLIGSPFLDSHQVIGIISSIWNPMIDAELMKSCESPASIRLLHKLRLLQDPIMISHMKFQPTFNKHQGRVCNAIALRFLSDPRNSHLQALGLVLALIIALLHPLEFIEVCGMS